MKQAVDGRSPLTEQAAFTRVTNTKHLVVHSQDSKVSCEAYLTLCDTLHDQSLGGGLISDLTAPLDRWTYGQRSRGLPKNKGGVEEVGGGARIQGAVRNLAAVTAAAAAAPSPSHTHLLC